VIAALAQIRRELECQLALARDWGIAATHADTHQHVHMNPAIFSVLEDLLPCYGITRLRFCREPFSLPFGPDLPAVVRRFNPAKWALLRWRSAQLEPRLASNDDFFGVMHSGCVSKQTLAAVIARMPVDRSLEVCIHPGFSAARGERFYPHPAYNAFISSPARQAEHDILVEGEMRELVHRRGLILRAFDGRPKG
jgi:chitin disaccharide deacetylase